MSEIRYDVVPIKAETDANGHIKDTPILSRVGVFPYRDPTQKGGIRYEFRSPEEVFKAEHLSSLLGKPITVGHPKGLAHSRKDAAATLGPDGKPWRSVGAALSVGRQDGDNLIGDIVIHHPEAVHDGYKELSLGYRLDVVEEPGEWNGQKFSHRQKALLIDHVALVPKGRAGTARLNLDAAEMDSIVETPIPNPPRQDTKMADPKLGTVRLDGGLPYDVPLEVVVAFDNARETMKSLRADSAAALTAVQTKAEADVAAHKTRADEAVSRADAAVADAVKARDKAQAEADVLKGQMDKVRADAAAEGRAAAIARLGLEGQAKTVGYSFNADASDTEIRTGMVAKLSPDLRLDGKSADYITAAFDMSMDAFTKRGVNAGSQRATVINLPVRQDAADGNSAAAARQRMLKGA